MLRNFVLTLLALLFFKIVEVAIVGKTTRDIVKTAAGFSFPLLNAHSRAISGQYFSKLFKRSRDWIYNPTFTNKNRIIKEKIRGPT